MTTAIDQNSATAGHWPGRKHLSHTRCWCLGLPAVFMRPFCFTYTVSPIWTSLAGMACERPIFSTKRRWSSVIFKLLFFVVVMLRNSCNFSCSRWIKVMTGSKQMFPFAATWTFSPVFKECSSSQSVPVDKCRWPWEHPPGGLEFNNYSGLPFEIQFLKAIKEDHSCLRLLNPLTRWARWKTKTMPCEIGLPNFDKRRISQPKTQ